MVFLFPPFFISIVRVPLAIYAFSIPSRSLIVVLSKILSTAPILMVPIACIQILTVNSLQHSIDIRKPLFCLGNWPYYFRSMTQHFRFAIVCDQFYLSSIFESGQFVEAAW